MSYPANLHLNAFENRQEFLKVYVTEFYRNPGEIVDAEPSRKGTFIPLIVQPHWLQSPSLPVLSEPLEYSLHV
jgi:hypothetical protein